jgi:hypothetical protein
MGGSRGLIIEKKPALRDGRRRRNMEKLIDSFVVQVLDSLDKTPIAPTKEELFLAFLICKNLADLCETGTAILNQMGPDKIKDLPQPKDVETCRLILQRFYSDSMFIPDDNMGSRPNWKEMAAFDQVKSAGAYRIYRVIRNNVIAGPTGVNGVTGAQIQEAIKRHDTAYFSKNFDLIFMNFPEQFKQSLIRFKNFVSSPHVSQDHRDCVWEFFESLLEIYLDEDEHLKKLRALPS